MHSEIKLVCFDLNKTLIHENTWYNLNLALGISHEEDQRMLKEYEAGTLTYEDWLVIILDLYLQGGKATKETIEKVVYQYTYLPFAKDTVIYLTDKGYKTALITGGVAILAERVAAKLGIHFWKAHHQFVFNTEGLLTDITIQGDEQQTKVLQLEEICRELGINLAECACIGDGDNDAELFIRTGHGITFTGSRIESLAWKVINSLADIKNTL